MSDPELDGVTKCPNCGEENDCELFNCANRSCEKIICEKCASSGMCEACDNKVHGTVTIHFR